MRHVSVVLVTALFGYFSQDCVTGDPGASTPPAPKNIFYADPIKGSTSKGDGTKAKPWGSLESIIDARLINGGDPTIGKVHANDLIYLMTGNHGSASLWGPAYQNTEFITLQAAPGQKPVMNSLTLTNCSKWVVRGLIFENPSVVTNRKPLLHAQNSSELILDSNRLRSSADARNWSPSDWEESSATYGIFTNNITNSTISRNAISFVENGIAATGKSLAVFNNKVDYFANDGIQFTASDSIISRNRVTNHYGLWNNGYHHDLMQGWTAWNEERTDNVVLDGNFLMASTGVYPKIPAVPTGEGDDYIQGITIFDGLWDNLTVTNNVVAAAGFHGLSLYHVKNSKVMNNTIVQQCPKFGTWLGVFGTSENVMVRNNIAYTFALPATGVVFDSNLALKKSWQSWQRSIPVYTNPVGVFAKWSPKTAEFDLRLAPKSFAIGRGHKQSFATRDIVYVGRSSTRSDMGAYAFVPQ